MDELVRKFRQVAFTVSFLGQQNQQIDAAKITKAHKIDLKTLAKFSYLLNKDIVFEYQERPQNRHYDADPTLILVFEFMKKGPIAAKVIEKRIERFQLALQQFCSRRDLGELNDLAKVPIEPQHSRLASKTSHVLDILKDIAVEIRQVPAKEAVYSTEPIDEDIKGIMARKSIERLYSHQSEGINYLTKQKLNIIVSTATASGKTFIFQAPIICTLEQDSSSTALFIYPTKALAQDQLQIFQNLTPVNCGTFDGDTELEDRDVLQKSAQALFTNPDILHCTVLPHWNKWQDFLAELRYVVIDEIHTYKGVFGAHVALILRRLRRICSTLGNDSLQFICCSATIERPIELMHELTGLPTETIRLVSKDGSPHATKHYFLINCDDGRPMKVAAPIVVQLAKSEFKTIAFCKYRKECELLMRAIRSQPDVESIIDSIMGYRGGYSKQDRRQIEKDMFDNKLKGIIATSALEVGIDIGSLDAVVLCGFPSSLASLRQQIGRVGRRNRDSIIVYVAGKHVQDQTYLRNPDLLFDAKDPTIPLSTFSSVIEAHLQCAACELALETHDLEFFDFEETERALHKLQKDEDDLYHCTWGRYPSKQVNIRHIEEESTAIIDTTDNKNALLETIESFRVGFTAYPGAIYVHQGLPYLVVDLEENLSYAKVVRTNVKWTTRQRDYTDVDPIESYGNLNITPETPCNYGTIFVKTVVFGYFKVDERSRIIEAHDLTLPPVERISNGLWVNLPTSSLKLLSDKKLHAGASIHAAEHLLMKISCEFVPAAVSDIATECKAPEKELAKHLSLRQRPARLIFYSRYTGEEGRNFWSRVHPQIEDIVAKACKVLDNCPCDIGCAKCVALGGCSEKNIVLSKRGAQVILRSMLNRAVDDIENGPEQHLIDALEGTVKPV